MVRPVVVLVDDSIGKEAREFLAPLFDVRVLEGQYPSEARLAAAVTDADAILARLATVTRSVIEAAPKLRIISRHGVGVDGVDLEAATRNGIIVTTTGAANAAAVAEYTFALILGLLRHVPAADANMRMGAWNRAPQIGMELEGKVFGVMGLGVIGRRVARQAIGFGMHVLAHDPFIDEPSLTGVDMVPFSRLLQDADIVSLHLRLGPSTRSLIGSTELALMKKTAVLANTSRGELVDEPALIEALNERRIAGAALDTFDQEPLAKLSPLRSMPNVILSPHVAGQTHEALARVGIAAANAIVDELSGRRPAFVFNPEAYANRPAAAR